MSQPAELLIEVDNFRIQKSIEINARKHLSNWSPSTNRAADRHKSTPNDGSPRSSHSSSGARRAANNNDSGASNISAGDNDDLNDSLNGGGGGNTTAELNQNFYDRKLTILKRVNFYDENNRPLFLVARITFKIGSNQLLVSSSNDAASNFLTYKPCPIVIRISAVYCFFNLTGLPLIFRQYNCDEAAGQLEEHEVACSNQPLLFSFNEVHFHFNFSC